MVVKIVIDRCCLASNQRRKLDNSCGRPHAFKIERAFRVSFVAIMVVRGGLGAGC